MILYFSMNSLESTWIGWDINTVLQYLSQVHSHFKEYNAIKNVYIIYAFLHNTNLIKKKKIITECDLPKHPLDRILLTQGLRVRDNERSRNLPLLCSLVQTFTDLKNT